MPPVNIEMWLLLAVNVLTRAVPKIGEIWGDGMSNNASKIDDRRKTSIADEITYQSKIAEPSELGYRQLIDPSFISRTGKLKDAINRTQAHKVKKAFDKYEKSWDEQFAEGGKKFKERVRNVQDIYAKRVAETTLSLTGIKALESGPARIAVYFLSGDARARGILRPADRVILPSHPFNITTPEKRSSLRQVLLSNLVRSGAAIIHSQLDSTVITSQNTLLDSLAQGFVDPALGIVPFGTDSHLHYVVENGQLFLSVKVARS